MTKNPQHRPATAKPSVVDRASWLTARGALLDRENADN